MSYFGVLKAGAKCIPIDAESSTSEVVIFPAPVTQRRCHQRKNCEERRLREKLTGGRAERYSHWTFDEVLELPTQEVEDERIALLPQSISPQS